MTKIFAARPRESSTACCNARFPISGLDVSSDTPAAKNRSDFAFRHAFRRLAANPTAKFGLKSFLGQPEYLVAVVGFIA